MNLKSSFLFVNVTEGSIIIIRKFVIRKKEKKINNIFEIFSLPLFSQFFFLRLKQKV